MSGLVFTVDLPPVEASKSFHTATRGGRQAQNKAIQRYKDACEARIRAAMEKGDAPQGPLVVHYFWYLGRRKAGKRALRDGLYRPKDHDNAVTGAWPIQDAMQKAGLLPHGDAAGRVRPGDVKLFGRAKDHGGQMCVMVLVMADAELAA